MSKAKYLEIGQSLSRLCYIDKDDIRHMQRLAGYDNTSNDISALLPDAQKTNRHLQAPSALLHALVDSSISKLLDLPAAGRHQRTILDDIGNAYAGDTVTVNVNASRIHRGWVTFDVEVVNEHGQKLVQGTVESPMP